MKHTVLLMPLVLTLCIASEAGGTQPAGSISAISPQGRTITVTPLTDNILRIDNVGAGERVAQSKTTIVPDTVGKPFIEQTADYTTLHTPTGVTARLDRHTGALTIDAGNGKLIHDNGHRPKDSGGRTTLKLLSGETDSYYGGGERGWKYNLASDTLTMYNRQNYGYTGTDPRIKQMNITMPLVLSPKGFALLFDDYAEAELLTSSPLQYSTVSPDAVSYYFINSPEGFSNLTEQITDLTGRQDLPPLWSLGYITSKYGYKTQAETDSVVSALKKDGYPLDGIVLDLYWYGREEDMGRLAWDPIQWPDHKKMLADLRDKGVNLTAISQPYVLTNGKALSNYNELSAKGMFGKDSVGGVKEVEIWVGRGGMFDMSNPDTRAWLRNRYKELTDEGIGGWWGDLGEPEKHPDGMIHANGLTNRQYHNLYGNDWSSIIYDLFRDEYPDRRLMSLMRGGTTGLQRYSVFPWSTDVSRSWGGLAPQIKIMLNSGLSGLGYMSHDVGGFAIDEANPIDPELYVRWLQLGLFSPVLRTHAQQYAEPFHYPQHKDLLLNLIRERYRWLPYNYTLAYENSTKGTPLVRPIGLYEADPAVYDDVDDEYLWGSNLLVAPVLTRGATTRKVLFPSGEWVDINNPRKVYPGGSEAIVEAPLHTIPLFARAGALIPKALYKMENTGDYSTRNLTIEYYPTPGCGSSEFTLFDDDHISPSSIRKGEYQLITFTADNSSHTLSLTAHAFGSFPDMPQKRELEFVVHNVDRPSSVDGARMSYNKNTRTLRLKATLEGTLPLVITCRQDAIHQ